MNLIIRILILTFGLILAPLSSAEELVTSRAAFEDVTGTLSIADVAEREFKPVGPKLFNGFTNSAYWLRLTVRKPANGNEVVLFIRQPYLNEIQLYEADAGDPHNWKTRVTGSHHAYSERERAKSTLGFIVNVTGPESIYYLRLKTNTVSQMSVEALTPLEAERIDNQFDLMEVFFATSMLALLFWAIYSYYLDRLPVVGLFAIHQAVYTLYGIGITGYLAPLMPAGYPQIADWVVAILYCAIGFTTLLFCRALFKPYAPPPWQMRGLKLLLLAFPVELVAIALGYIPLAVIINVVLVRVSWWYFVFMVFSLQKEQSPSRRLLQVSFVTITLIFTAFWVSNHTGLAETISNLGREILIVNGLIIASLFTMMMHARTRQLQHETQQSTLDLHLAKQKLELELKLREQAEGQARTDFLTGLFNRRHFIELAERELARAARYQRPLTLLIIDIDRFKVINDTLGHSIGDVVLQKVSIVISEALRDVDILGRIGGEEFAVVLPEARSDHALHAAQRLCKTVADAAIVSGVQVTISIGLTELKSRDIDLTSLMDEADRAMYRAKQLGRNRVVATEHVDTV